MFKADYKTPKRCQWRRSGDFIVDFEHTSHTFFCVSMVDFEQVNVIWLRAPNIRGGQNIVHDNICVTIILLEKKGILFSI